MARHTLYAYVDGNDLHDAEADIESEVRRFVNEAGWRHGRPWVVNQRRAEDPSLRPGELPDWDLGLNYDLPDPPDEPTGWFADVERIATFLARLHRTTGRDFVIGVSDEDRGMSDDLFDVDGPIANLTLLRQLFGVGDGHV